MATLYPAHEDVKFCMECSRAAGVVSCSSRYFIRTLSLKAPLALKKKLGIRRERVLFVLTEDFVLLLMDRRTPPDSCDMYRVMVVITKHMPMRNNELIKMRSLLAYCFSPSFRFQEMCEKAFLQVRRKGRPLLSLFCSMVGSGLPELRQKKKMLPSSGVTCAMQL